MGSRSKIWQFRSMRRLEFNLGQLQHCGLFISKGLNTLLSLSYVIYYLHIVFKHIVSLFRSSSKKHWYDHGSVRVPMFGAGLCSGSLSLIWFKVHCNPY